jgi:hypothetical protein
MEVGQLSTVIIAHTKYNETFYLAKSFNGKEKYTTFNTYAQILAIRKVTMYSAITEAWIKMFVGNPPDRRKPY